MKVVIRRCRHIRATIAVFFLLLLSDQLCLSSAEHGGMGRPRQSGRRKARSSDAASSFHSASNSAQVVVGGNQVQDSGSGKLYQEDKRTVESGPNPLHN
ncbi:hypothetical protein RHGRI_026711 [Rhododendron griersonianum]|uniref:Uncharacterized protein n=1 Tax=Rhododendron griersonianum TaxID=479676 RepID=A0AAV6IUU9_9ERIC|nr:hypothetical protein RHGRI_026711 [Rhododendron griersonianum]